MNSLPPDYSESGRILASDFFSQSVNTNEDNFWTEKSYFKASIASDWPRYVPAVYNTNSHPRSSKYLAPRPTRFVVHPECRKKAKKLMLDRTPKQLVACLSFYVCLWGFVLGITFVFLMIHSWFTGMVSYNRPTFVTQDSPLSLISSREYSHPYYYGNPALAFRPLVKGEYNLIWFIPGMGHIETWAHYVGSIEAFLEHYKEQQTAGCMDCTKKQFPPPPIELDSWVWGGGFKARRACCFHVKDLEGECMDTYGFESGRPCILLKLNRIVNWMPMLYLNKSEVPEEILDRWDPKYIGVNCQGIHPPDRDHIGEIKYYPTSGFPFYYYPYRAQSKYRSPVVFAQFLNPTPGILIMIECRAYARNIEINGPTMMGSVRFELLVDVAPPNAATPRTGTTANVKQSITLIGILWLFFF